MSKTYLIFTSVFLLFVTGNILYIKSLTAKIEKQEIEIVEKKSQVTYNKKEINITSVANVAISKIENLDKEEEIKDEKIYDVGIHSIIF